MLNTVYQEDLAKVSNRYKFLLQKYIAHEGEDALHQVYELGRSALALGKGFLFLCSIHHEVLASVLEPLKHPTEVEKATLRARDFLMHCLASFEMTHQGFLEANASLIQANKDLFQRTEELVKINLELDQIAIERKLAEENLRKEVVFIEILQKIAVAANESPDVFSLLKAALAQICSYTGWLAGCALTELCYYHIWHFRQTEEKLFVDFFENLRRRNPLIFSDLGLLSRRQFWVQDLTIEPDFAETRKDAQIEIKVAFVFPVVQKSKLIAVLTFFSRDRSDFDFRFLEVMNLILDQIGKAVIRINRQRLEQNQLKTSLQEKELLLHEIHHRVKNNLQIIYSLLNLQSDHVKSKEVSEIFNKCQNQIKSIALLHETLYQSNNLAQIDFSEYVRHLSENLLASYGVDTSQIMLKIDIENIFLGVDTAIPCGLIINELVSNALKHAFPNHRKGEIQVSFYQELIGKLVLVVSDNGIGVPENFNFRNSGSLGFELVNTLTDQLNGIIDLINRNGMTVRIIFPLQGRGSQQ
jgi:two-component sensor histidine kinase